MLNITENTTKTDAPIKKRKRGRPKKERPQLPIFKNEMDIRNYLLNTSLELALECKTIAMKKNNIKKHEIANAKNQQFKTALNSLKIVNDILKDKQLDKLEEKILLMEEGLTTSILENTSEDTEIKEDTLYKIDKLTELTKELASIKL